MWIPSIDKGAQRGFGNKAAIEKTFGDNDNCIVFESEEGAESGDVEMDTKDDIVVEGDLESGVIKIPISFKETWKRKKVEGKTKVKDDIGKKKQKKG